MASAKWSSEALGTALDPLVGGRVRATGPLDTVGGLQPAVVIEPATEEEVSAALAFADREGLKILTRGGGTQSELGHAPSGGDILLSTYQLEHVLEHNPADLTATVEAGMSLADFQGGLKRSGQWLALDPALPLEATIGGIVATGASGPRRLRYGGVRDQIIGVRVVRADGVVAKGGGKVVKNVAGFDLPKLFTGSLGTLGVIVNATFRLYPLAASSRTVFMTSPRFDQLCDLAVKIIGTTLVPSAITVVGTNILGRCHLVVRFEGVQSAVEDQAESVLKMTSWTTIDGTILLDDGERDVWGAITAGPGDESRQLRLKVSLVPTAISPWIAKARDEATRRELTITYNAHVGHGLLDVGLEGPVEALPALVSDLRAAAVAAKGSLVVTEGLPEVIATLDPWGPSPGLDLMRRIKAEFDPRNTLNPGRFIGGI
ncbi:MAG: FAD-binding oxidoreductase [Chloroflexia bacterium]